MKKVTSLFLALVMCLSLCACGKTPEPPVQNTPVVITPSIEEGSLYDDTESSQYTAFVYEGDPVDALTVEEVVLMPEYVPFDGSVYLKWKMKVRNTSGADIPMKESSMRVWYRYLDKNEDTMFSLYDTAGYSSTIKDGRAEWIEITEQPAEWTNKEVLNVAYIEIYAYTISLHGAPDFEFSEPVLIDVRDYFDWETVQNDGIAAYENMMTPQIEIYTIPQG